MKGYPQRHVSIAQAASHAQLVRGEPPIASASWNPPTVPLDPETGQGKPFSTYVYATQIAEVEVDDETGEVEVIRIVAAHDCGRAINPMLVEGQVHGGIAMGLGFALQEEMLFDACGEQINPNLTNYIVPTSLDMPDIDVIIVETPDPTGPFNAKGVGEPTSVPTAAAVLNAIHDAVGVRLTSLPATAERILAALQERKAQPQGRSGSAGFAPILLNISRLGRLLCKASIVASIRRRVIYAGRTRGHRDFPVEPDLMCGAHARDAAVNPSGAWLQRALCHQRLRRKFPAPQSAIASTAARRSQRNRTARAGTSFCYDQPFSLSRTILES